MRIIAGQWRGRKLQAPPGGATRPTADRVREALFSMLASRLGSFEGLRVADLFAGSGALGLEVLSRGASHCTFVERDPGALEALKANVARLGASAEVIAISTESLGAATAPCDLVLLDPPYGSGLAGPMLARLMAQGWLAPGCWISVETGRGETVEVAELRLDTVREIGKAQLTLLRRPA